jgi:hypothetical protein
MYKLQIVFPTEKDTRMSTGKIGERKETVMVMASFVDNQRGPPVIISNVIPSFCYRDQLPSERNPVQMNPQKIVVFHTPSGL